LFLISQTGCIPTARVTNQQGVPTGESRQPTPSLAAFFIAPENTPTLRSLPSAIPVATSTPTVPVTSQSVDAIIEVDISRNVHPISPLIYGVSGAPEEVLRLLKPSLHSWGGNPSTRYNWKIGNAWNAGRDWFYRNGNYGFEEGSASEAFVINATKDQTAVRLALPILGWVAKDNNNDTCSFPMADGSCGDANLASCENPGPVADPRVANVASDPGSIAEWLTSLYALPEVDIRFLAMDNEPELWGITHYDVHPTCTTYDEILSKHIEYAEMAREVAPNAEIVGPVTCCWNYYWNSAAGEADKAIHDNQDFLPWFLDSVRQNDEEKGSRSLDVLDIHYYPEGLYNDDVDVQTAARRLRSVRSLWDESYVDESWISQPIYLIPRMQALIEEHYPGTRFGISEWNWGAEKSMNGALAIADVLGTFGREELYYASYWTYPELNSPGFYAFRMYTNYDGMGSRFGDASVFANSTDQDLVSSYAAIDSSTHNLHLMLINKSPVEEVTVDIELIDFTPMPGATAYQYFEANNNEIIKTELSVTEEDLTTTLPAYSITLLVIQPEVP